MLKKIYNPLFLLSLFFSLILILIIFFLIKDRNTIAFVDNAKIFNDFKMTKELIKNGEKELKQKRGRLDTLYAYLNHELCIHASRRWMSRSRPSVTSRRVSSNRRPHRSIALPRTSAKRSICCGERRSVIATSSPSSYSGYSRPSG